MACTRKKFICLVSALLVLLLAIVCSGLFVYLNNRGSHADIETMGELVPEDGLSSVWCQGVTIETEDVVMRFNASMVPGQPKVDKSHMRSDTVTLTLFVPASGYYMLKYFLPATSAIRILQCASEPNVMSYIFKGKEVDDECLKLTEHRLPWWHEDWEDLGYKMRDHVGKDPCAGITLQRFLVKVCKGTAAKMQPMDANIAEDDYYIIYYKGGPADANVTMKLTLVRPSYDLSDQLHSCTGVTFCYLPYRWGKSDSIVVRTGMGVTGEHTLKWTCLPNWISYAVIFCGLPMILILCIIFTVLFCKFRRRRKVSERQPLLDEDRSRVLEDHMQSSRQKYGATEPEDVVSQPSHSAHPSAPPQISPFIDDDMVQPFYSREPPPPYQENPPDQSPARMPVKC